MSQSDQRHGSFLDVLPALTLLVIVAVFSMQAISAPTHSKHDLESSLADQHLPQIGSIAPFQLIERSGSSINQEHLAGKIWVADFMFTSCTAECPLMALEMQKIQAAFVNETRVKLVSFTVDPEVDTPEVLRQYAEQLSASEQGWLFVTGVRKALYALAIDGFKLPVQDLQADHHHTDEHTGHTSMTQLSAPFLHSQKFVLVDQNLKIRGYYDSTDSEAMSQLITQDIPELLQQL